MALIAPPPNRHHSPPIGSCERLLTGTPGPYTSLDQVVGPDRTLAVLRGDLDEVRRIAHAHNAKLNDVFLALTAGGLRGLLQSRGEQIHDLNLPIYVPVSLRSAPGQAAAGNLISQMVIRLPIGIDDPVVRLP